MSAYSRAAAEVAAAGQLLLDVYADDRRRPVSAARIAEQQHQRGWITMPYTSGLGPAGTVVAAWLCCRCGSPETSAYLLNINHACCTSIVPGCTRPGRRPGRFDQCWTPHHPIGAAA